MEKPPQPPPEPGRRVLCALVFTDIVGSMPLKQRLGDSVGVGIIERHDAVMRSCLALFPKAHESERAGDSFLLVFPGPAEAVHFALLFQRELRAFSAEVREEVHDRIGIHVAEIELEKVGGVLRPVRGIHLDICSRIMMSGRADQILLSRAAFDGARAVLSVADLEGFALLSWLNHGHYALKDIEDPIEVCEVGEQGFAVLKAPANSSKMHRVTTAEGEPVLGWRPALGQQVPGTAWLLEALLGEGGFGEVWLARNAVLRQQRVFKFCFRVDRVRSLRREVMLFGLLRQRVGEHRNIVTLHDVYFNEPPFYLVMEYVEGADLARWAKELAAVPLATRLEIVAQVADALQAAHEAGIIHRDVKPSNILIGGKPGPLEVKLTDFGIGQLVSREALAGVTQLGLPQTILANSSGDGTRLYLSPELLAGETATTSSDIYSLGVVLWQLIAGDFRRPLTTDWAEKVTDPLLRADLQRCFASDAGTRFSAAQLAASLRNLETRRAAHVAELARLAAREKRAYRRGVARTAAVGLLIVALVAGLAVFAFQQARRARSSAAAETVSRGRAETLVAGMQLRRADDYLGSGNAAAGLAYLAAIVRRDPQNAVAAERLLSVLRDRNFALPLTAPLPHGQSVIDCAFSPDSERLATVTEKATWIWDVNTGARLFGPLPAGGRSVAFSPDGAHLAVVGARTQLRDARTGALRFEVESGASIRDRNVRCGALFSADSTRLVTLTEQTSAQLWDVRTGAPAGPPLRCPASIRCVGFSPDGGQLALGCENGTTVLWDAVSGELRRNLPGGSPVLRVAFRPDGRQLATGLQSGEIHRWDVANGASLGEVAAHALDVTGLGYNPEGTLLVSTGDEGAIKLWDAASNEARGELQGDHYWARGGAFSRDGRRISARTGQGVVIIWDVATRRLAMEPIRSQGFPDAAVFSPDGRRFATACTDGSARLWDVDRAAAEPLRIDHHAALADAALCPGGREILTAGRDGRVRFWDTATGLERLPSLRLEQHLQSAAFSLDGSRVVTVTDRDSVQLWDARKATPLGPPIPSDQRVLTAEVGEDGHSIFIARLENGAQVWDGLNGQPITPRLMEKTARAVLAPQHAHAALAGENSVGVWALPKGEPLASIAQPPLAALALSASGRLFAGAGRDNAVRVWKASDAAAAPLEFRPPNIARTVEFSPDERLLATTSYDRDVHLWSAATGERLGEVLAHPQFLLGTCFSPVDARRLLTWCDDGVRLWSTADAALLAEPLRVGSGVQRVSFSDDGQHALITPARSHQVLLWELPAVPVPSPDWLADWAEAVGGRRLDALGALGDVDRGALARMQERVQSFGDADLYTRTARWFFTPRSAQTLSPLSSVPRATLEQRGSFPTRDPRATRAQIDLTSYYNCRLDEGMIADDVGNNLEELEPGLREFNGVNFDVRGVVQLGNTGLLARFPRELRGIACGQPCRALNLLHAGAFVSTAPETELARYVVHYADGTKAEIPQMRGRDLDDWWTEEAAPPLTLAWKGSNPFARAHRSSIALFTTRWENPRPEEPVTTIDLLATHEIAAPFVVAITAE